MNAQRQALTSSPTDARAITDEPVESEESESRSPYGSESTMSSSFSSSSTSTSEQGAESANEQQQQQTQQQQNTNQQPRRRYTAVSDGEIARPISASSSSIPHTAVVRRRPLHETLDEDSDDNFEVALSWHRNRRILLGRLMETSPRGRLSLVRFKIAEK